MERNIEKLQFDLVVIGAGIAGMTAAIAAARHGLRVALIGDRPVPGGNASTEVGVNINGAAYNAFYSPSVYARETGIVEEIKQKLFRYDGCRANRMAGYDAALLEMLYQESNLSLYLNTSAQKVRMDGVVIRSVSCIQLMSERLFEFEAEMFIDASGDGLVGAQAGAEYMKGSEAKAQYGESLAPDVPNLCTNGGTLMFYSRDVGHPVAYKRPAFAHDITKLDFFKNLGTKHRVINRSHDGNFYGLWWVEYGGHLDTVTDNEEIVLELRRLVYGFWDYIKNSGDFPNVDNLILERVCPVIGKRESRRFVGDYVLSQNDLIEKTDFKDAVFMGGWPMDVHANKGIYDDDYATHWNFVPGMYNGPFRSLYSKNIKNLMFAGRNISATRVANGSTRVIGTCAATGQAVGTAAAVCKSKGVFPKELSGEDIALLQKILIKDDQTLVGYKEKFEIENAKIKTSSVHILENNNYTHVRPLEKPLCLALPLVKRLDGFQVKIKNLSEKPQVLKYRFLTGSLPECYLPEAEVKADAVEVSAKYDGFIKIFAELSVGADGKLYCVFEQNEALQIYCHSDECTGAPTFRLWEKEPDLRDPRRFVLTRIYDNIAFDKVTPVQSLYEGENVISGYSRPYGHPNLWMSKSDKDEYLELSFDAKRVGEVQLVFNTDLAEDIIRRQCTKTIRAYTLILSGDGFRREIEVKDNYDRVNIHQVDAVLDKVVFVPKQTYGAPHFELFSIKVY